MHYLSEFAFTQTTPTIAWLPKFNKATTKLLIENRKKEVAYNYYFPFVLCLTDDIIKILGTDGAVDIPATGGR